MISIVTSFSPNPQNADRQIECCESWLADGFTVRAVQGAEEIIPDRLVNRINVVRIDEPGPPRLFHLLRAAASQSVAMVLNSDVETVSGARTAIWDAINDWGVVGQNLLYTSRCLWLRRWNYVPTSGVAPSREKWGIDAFVLSPSPHLLQFFADLDLRIGQPGWDYVLPYWFLLRGLPLLTIDDPPLLLHREHPIRWSRAVWERNTILGAKALGLAPAAQLHALSQQLNLDVDKYSQRLTVSATVDATA